jgi:hypothetical protein
MTHTLETPMKTLFAAAALVALLAGQAVAGPVSGVAGTTDVSIIGAGSTPAPVPTGAANNPTAQVTVTTTSTQIVPVRAARAFLTIENDGTNDEWIGACPVTTTTGLHLKAGATGNYASGAAWCGITASGSNTNSEAEIY